MKTYRIGNLTSRGNRLLIDNDTDKVVGIALTNAGPAHYGLLTEVGRKDEGPGYYLTLTAEKEDATVFAEL